MRKWLRIPVSDIVNQTVGFFQNHEGFTRASASSWKGFMVYVRNALTLERQRIEALENALKPFADLTPEIKESAKGLFPMTQKEKLKLYYLCVEAQKVLKGDYS